MVRESIWERVSKRVRENERTSQEGAVTFHDFLLCYMFVSLISWVFICYVGQFLFVLLHLVLFFNVSDPVPLRVVFLTIAYLPCFLLAHVPWLSARLSCFLPTLLPWPIACPRIVIIACSFLCSPSLTSLCTFSYVFTSFPCSCHFRVYVSPFGVLIVAGCCCMSPIEPYLAFVQITLFILLTN